MSSKPTRRKDVLDSIINLKKRQREINGLSRQNFSGLGSSEFGAVSSTGSSGGSGSNGGNNDNDHRIKSMGDTMIGPLAFYPIVKIIASGVLDVGEDGGYSSRVIATVQSGSADNIVRISNASYSGQILFIQAVNTTPITLKHYTDEGSAKGNIFIPGNADHIIGSKEIVLLQWDTINVNPAHAASGTEFGQWTLVSGGGSGSSGMNNPATADLDMNSWDVVDVDRLTFIQDAGVATNVNTPQIYISSAASDMVFNNNANDFTWKHSNVISMSESSTTLKKEAGISPSFVLFNSRTAAIGTAASVYFDAKETTTGNVSMGYITAETQDSTVNGSGSLHLGVRESGSPANYIELNEADDNNIRIHRSLVLNTSTIFLDADNDTYIESQSDDQLKIFSGGTNVMNIKPTVVLVTQNIDMLGAKVTGLATPTDTTDAATKAYVDAGGSGGWNGSATSDLDMNNFDIKEVGQIEFSSTSHYIKSNSVGFEYRVPVGDDHEFFVNGVSEFKVDGGVCIVKNDLQVDDDVTLGSTSADAVTVNGLVNWATNYSAVGLPASTSAGYITIQVAGVAKKLYYYS